MQTKGYEEIKLLTGQSGSPGFSGRVSLASMSGICKNQEIIYKVTKNNMEDQTVYYLTFGEKKAASMLISQILENFPNFAWLTKVQQNVASTISGKQCDPDMKQVSTAGCLNDSDVSFNETDRPINLNVTDMLQYCSIQQISGRLLAHSLINLEDLS